MEIVLIRHGMTEGNKEKRYIGRTEEPVCPEGIQQLFQRMKEKPYPKVEAVYASPMIRCLQTAEILYPDKITEVISDFRERDFGELEGKNYKDLADHEAYQAWIRSNGSLPFPAGEVENVFRERMKKAWEELLRKMTERGQKRVALVCHGGCIMTLLWSFDLEKKDHYHDYMCQNGDYYLVEWKENGMIRKEKSFS